MFVLKTLSSYFLFRCRCWRTPERRSIASGASDRVAGLVLNWRRPPLRPRFSSFSWPERRRSLQCRPQYVLQLSLRKTYPAAFRLLYMAGWALLEKWNLKVKKKNEWGKKSPNTLRIITSSWNSKEKTFFKKTRVVNKNKRRKMWNECRMKDMEGSRRWISNWTKNKRK